MYGMRGDSDGDDSRVCEAPSGLRGFDEDPRDLLYSGDRAYDACQEGREKYHRIRERSSCPPDDHQRMYAGAELAVPPDEWVSKIFECPEHPMSTPSTIAVLQPSEYPVSTRPRLAEMALNRLPSAKRRQASKRSLVEGRVMT